MPYPVAHGGILEVTLKGRVAGQVTLTVLHYMNTGFGAIADGDSEINLIHSWAGLPSSLYDNFTTGLASDWLFEEVVYQWITPTRFRRLTFVPGFPSGQQLGISSPPHVAAIVTKTGLLATRRGIGNVHVPGLPKDSCVLGRTSDGLNNDLLLLAAKLSIRPTGSVCDPVIYNHSAPDTSIVVERAAPQRILRALKRREVGRGI